MDGPLPATGVLAGPLHLYALRVFFEDTDLTGVVYHANYLRWFERARTDLLACLGIAQGAAFRSGLGNYAVAELTIRYKAPARLDDVVTIETRAIDVRAATCRLGQRALRGGLVLAEATVRVGFLNAAGRPAPQPASWRAAFATLRGSLPPAEH